MYHEKFKGSPYEMGFRWDSRLAANGNYILENIGFPMSMERLRFAAECLPVYQNYFPEILEEIRGIADGQNCPPEMLHAFLFSMYAMPPACCCSCFAVSTQSQILFGRNSDFLTSLKKTNQNVIYRFSAGTSFSFTGNTTAFVQMEDGVNEHGLAAGLTSVYPHTIRPGINAGLLLRFFLEKCRTTEEVLASVQKLPLSSAQTFTIADASGSIALVECCGEKVTVSRPGPLPFVCATNLFHTPEMMAYNNLRTDNWEAKRRFQTMDRFLTAHSPQMDFTDAVRLLSGREGFLCQYDTRTGKDTVWSVIYDLKKREIFRAEGNPGRKQFRIDKRFSFS